MLPMPFHNAKFYATALLVLFAVACKKDDPGEDDPGIEPEPKKVVISFDMMLGGEPVNLDQSMVDKNGQWILPTQLKFYVSDLTLSNNSEQKVLSEIELVDFEPFNAQINNPQWENELAFELESGTFNELKFSLGVRPDLNNSEPTDYENDHPLSVYTNMYWAWATMYRFVILEARGNQEGKSDAAETLVYHIGTNDLYRPGQRFDVDVDMNGEGNDTVHVEIDLEALFDPAKGVDFSTNSNTHTVDTEDDYGHAVSFMDRFVEVMSIRP